MTQADGLPADRLFYDSFEFGLDVPVRVLARQRFPHVTCDREGARQIGIGHAQVEVAHDPQGGAAVHRGRQRHHAEPTHRVRGHPLEQAPA